MNPLDAPRENIFARMQRLRVVFFGTPDFAVASLKALVEDAQQAVDVVGVVTATDKPAGRGHRMQSPPVKVYAESQNIPVLQPTNMKSAEFQDALRDWQADLQIVVAFRMMPEAVWNMPRLGTYNVHASLLPDYRGAAPINWAIIRGEKETGVTTFKLRHEIDTGSILLQKRVDIGPDETAGELHDKLMHAGAELLVKSVQRIASGDYILQPQSEVAEVKEAPKIFKHDCRINWSQRAEEVHNFIRGLCPFPGAFTEVELPDGKKEQWKIQRSRTTGDRTDSAGQFRQDGDHLLVSCADEWLEILEIQPPGKKRMKASDFLRGLRVPLEDVRLSQ